jgi:hypothetical protein
MRVEVLRLVESTALARAKLFKIGFANNVEAQTRRRANV